MELAMGHFNPLKSFDRLKEAGVPEKQARAIVQTFEESSVPNLEIMATKGDIRELRAEMKGDFGQLKTDILWLKRLYFGSVLLIIVNIAITLLHH